MNLIARTISNAIKESKWLNITYKNKQGEITKYWIAIFDVDFENKSFIVSMFNESKSLDSLDDKKIFFDGIVLAEVIDFTSYEVPKELIEKLEKREIETEWLEYDHFDNNILSYYKECCFLDTDPFQNDYCLISGIDLDKLRKQKFYALNEEQERAIIEKIYHYDINDKSNFSKNDLIISRLSIDKGNKKYLICYYDITFNPKDKTLRVSNVLKFNKSFLIEGRKHSLSNYIEMNVNDFINGFEENYDEYREMLIESASNYGEKVDERPDMMILQREMKVNLEQTYYSIEEKYINNELPVPLKSFFGNISRNNYKKKKEPSIVIYDNRINIDQMRVLYNSIKYPVTYVQGPPGTGKTQTILNVILSAFLNEKTTLICSSNNRPVNGILEKLNFTYKNNKVEFPYLRLGNEEEVIRATKKIHELYLFETKAKPIDSLMDSIKNKNDKNNATLVELLNKYEQYMDIEDCLNSAKRLKEMLDSPDGKMAIKVNESIQSLKEKLKNTEKVTDEEVLSLFTPVVDDVRFASYLYFKSISYIQKLKLPRFKELIEICAIEEDKERALGFNKWSQNDDNIKLLNSAFPIIFTTNISSSRLGTGKYLFDLVIMDESGQCNVAHALLPIARANSLLLVGDPNQLKPVITLDPGVNDNLMAKYKISSLYDYTQYSILDVMKNHDNISKYILLRYHYRCGKKIINFSNQRYYDSQLNIDQIKEVGELKLLDVKNENKTERNTAVEEATAIVEYIERNKLEDVSIVTPFINQQALINRMLKEKNLDQVNCGTIHSVQGAENNTIIISSALSYKTNKKTYEWVKNNAELINVATTRAKKKLIVAVDSEALEALSKDKKDDFYNLTKYISANGEVVVPPSESLKIEIGFSNGSKNEEEAFKTLSHFCSCNPNYEVKRNVSFKKIFEDDPVLKNSNREFDMVLYKKVGLLKNKSVPKIAIEINGGEHLGTISREYSDKTKKEVCEKKDIKLVFISNDMVKSYEYIKEIIYSCQGKDFEQQSFMNVLFDNANE